MIRYVMIVVLLAYTAYLTVGINTYRYDIKGLQGVALAETERSAELEALIQDLLFGLEETYINLLACNMGAGEPGLALRSL